MITMIFYWIGIVGASLIGITLLAVLISFTWGWCKSALRHGALRYNRSRMCRRMNAGLGHSCALWLINYNERHGFRFTDYTAGEWERYFGEQARKEVKE